MADGPSLLQRTWYMLDTEVETIKEPTPETDVAKHRVRARAIAEVLAMFMVPHFTTADEIAQEAQRRYAAKKNGDESYETAGLGIRKYEPPPQVKFDPEAKKQAPAKKTTAPKASGKKIPENAVENVKKGLETQMFTLPMVAKMYHMSEAEVKAQLGLP